jgi:hypothetical protein
MLWLPAVLAFVSQAAMPPHDATNVRAWPGTCRGTCCSYNTEWIARRSVEAFAEPRVPGDRAAAPIFVVNAGESVRALTGTLFTLRTGTLRVDEDISTDATYSDFSDRHRQMVTLGAGETREIFAIRGETIYRISHKDTIIDANLRRVGTRDTCVRANTACAAVVISEPTTRWWAMVMNARQQAGWIEEPIDFTIASPCR